MTRPDWDEYFIGVAKAVSERGDCTRSKVGAVLVEDRTHRLLASGYNGQKPGEPGCLEGACPRGRLSYKELAPGGDYSNCTAQHSELNCLRYAEEYYPQYEWMKSLSLDKLEKHIPSRGDSVPFRLCTMYVTRKPCNDCEQELRVAGVRRAVWGWKTLGGYWCDSLDLTLPKF